jgi:hypothetical protein
MIISGGLAVISGLLASSRILKVLLVFIVPELFGIGWL